MKFSISEILSFYLYSGLNNLPLYLHSGYHETAPRKDPPPKARVLGGATPYFFTGGKIFWAFFFTGLSFLNRYFFALFGKNR